MLKLVLIYFVLCMLTLSACSKKTNVEVLSSQNENCDLQESGCVLHTPSPTQTLSSMYTPSPTPTLTLTGVLSLTPGVDFVSSIGLVFKEIPAGSFVMGDNSVPIESPSHQVTLSSFHMSSTVVTYGQWKIIYDWAIAHGYDFSIAGEAGYNPVGDVNRNPVVSVNWYDSIKWCNALAEKEGVRPAYYADQGFTQVLKTGQPDPSIVYVDWINGVYRLPTEAEWEYSCRAGSTSQYYWGSSVDGNYAWYWSNSNGTHEVGLKLPNSLGLYDMVGNVHQWVWDQWPSSYTSESQVNPKGPSSGWAVVNRGGAFLLDESYLKCSFRRGVSPSVIHDFDGGFRVAF